MTRWQSRRARRSSNASVDALARKILAEQDEAKGKPHKRKLSKPGQGSELERELARQIHAARLPAPVEQYRFHPSRKYRADFCWIQQRLIVEVQGGVWSGGRHTRGRGYIEDCERMVLAQLIGWRVLYVCATHIKSGKALAWIEEALDQGQAVQARGGVT